MQLRRRIVMLVPQISTSSLLNKAFRIENYWIM